MWSIQDILEGSGGRLSGARPEGSRGREPNVQSRGREPNVQSRGREPNVQSRGREPNVQSRGREPNVQSIAGFSIDSRTIRPGEVFIALVGPRFDGHDFVAQAFEKGAAGAIVSRSEFDRRSEGWGAFLNRRFFVEVDDPLSALQSMGTWRRGRFHRPVVGLTGSNGKTTTKEMIAAILSRRGPVLKNEGNLNNHIGLPLTLLRLKESDEAAVLEMGISQKGEMKRLCQIARPTVGLITNIGPAHLEFLSTLEGVAREKGALFEAVQESSGTAVINRDDPYLRPWEERVPQHWTFALDAPADVTASDLDQAAAGVSFRLHLNREAGSRTSDREAGSRTSNREGESGPVSLATVGRHQVYNALAAAAVACALGFGFEEIRAGLSAFRPVPLRAEIFEANGITFLLDAYNANPGSMRAALRMLADYRTRKGTRRKVALLGDMLELGREAETAHFEIGKAAAESRIDLLIAVGEWAEKVAEGARGTLAPGAIGTYPTVASAQKELRSRIQKGDVVLIKGSRGMKMEGLLAGLGVERG